LARARGRSTVTIVHSTLIVVVLTERASATV